MADEVKTCRTCGVTKPLTGFRSQVQKGGTVYHRLDCKECDRAALEKRYQERKTLPIDASATQVCKVCNRELPLSEFSPSATYKSGVRRDCKRCGSEKAMEWSDANWERNRDSRLRREFGITLEQYNAMLAEQGGACAICGEPPTIIGYRPSRRPGRPTRPILVVDHDHETGKIRGLLCIHCNRGIGFLKDSPDIVRFALKYLEERG